MSIAKASYGMNAATNSTAASYSPIIQDTLSIAGGDAEANARSIAEDSFHEKRKTNSYVKTWTTVKQNLEKGEHLAKA